jgi:UDP-N-acetylglucosamine pyrophosphorylase
MSFLDRLFHQLTRPPSSELDDISDEEFTEIDEKEITTVINNNIDQSLNNQDKLKKQNSLTKTIQSFIDEITEETHVIRGTLDEETLFNRRSRKAKYSFSTVENKQTLINRTSL